MIAIFYILALLLTYFGWMSLRGGFAYLAHFRNELSKARSDYAPPATIFAPCRGLDEDLEKNLATLFHQDYPGYEIVFVVDSPDDAAVSVIRKLIASNSRSNVAARLIVAGKADGESQKVHNLRFATGEVSAESEVFAFVDSDARPNAHWLRALAAPLEDAEIGASSSYRWFISKRMTLASELRSVWNASIASALGPKLETNFCWGGSMAIRRDVFDRIDMRERWRGTLSDDFAMTRAMKAEGLAIHFVPSAMAASVENCSLRECVEFTTRQMKITRVYAAPLWKLAFMGAIIFNLVWFWAIANLFVYPVTSLAFIASAATLVVNFLLGAGKSQLRLIAVRLVLKEYERELKSQFWTQNTLWMISPLLFFYNCVAAALSREIIWRGIKYRLDSPERTTVKLLK